MKFTKAGGVIRDDRSMLSSKSHHTAGPKSPRSSVHSRQLQFPAPAALGLVSIPEDYDEYEFDDAPADKNYNGVAS